MLTDISGNTFLNSRNNIIGVVYTPPQLFQSGLTIWYDFNDASTMYSDTGLTQNVVNGSPVLYVFNKAPNRPFYDLRHIAYSYPPRYGVSLPAFTGVSYTTGASVFCANTLNTNKNTVIFNQQTFPTLLSISGYSSSGSTAFTCSILCRNAPGQGNRVLPFHIVNTGSLSNARFITGIASATAQDARGASAGGGVGNDRAINPLYLYIGGVNLGSTNNFNFNFTLNRYILLTTVVDNSRNLFYYANDRLLFSASGINSAISAATLPFFNPSNSVYIHYAFGTTNPFTSINGAEVNEVVFSNSEALSEDRVIKLYHYFSQKYQFMYRFPNRDNIFCDGFF